MYILSSGLRSLWSLKSPKTPFFHNNWPGVGNWQYAGYELLSNSFILNARTRHFTWVYWSAYSWCLQRSAKSFPFVQFSALPISMTVRYTPHLQVKAFRHVKQHHVQTHSVQVYRHLKVPINLLFTMTMHQIMISKRSLIVMNLLRRIT